MQRKSTLNTTFAPTIEMLEQELQVEAEGENLPVPPEAGLAEAELAPMGTPEGLVPEEQEPLVVDLEHMLKREIDQVQDHDLAVPHKISQERLSAETE